MKQAYIKQHVVPKCYLDRFAENRNGKHIIGTRTITKNGKVKLFKQSTTEVGYIKNFYDVTDKEDEKYWEHFLAQEIDSLCDKKLEQIITSITLAGENYRLSSEDRNTLSTIVVAQMLRIPESVDYFMKEIYPRVSAEVKKAFYKSFPKSITQKYKTQVDAFEMTVQSQKENYLNYAFDHNNLQRFADILNNRTWIVFYNTISSELPFLTSDNPVLVENITEQNTLGIFKNGLINPGTCIFFPLTPSIAVANYSDKGLFTPVANKLDGRICPINESKYIINKNVLLMKNAYTHSFIPQPLFDSLKE